MWDQDSVSLTMRTVRSEAAGLLVACCLETLLCWMRQMILGQKGERRQERSKSARKASVSPAQLSAGPSDIAFPSVCR